MYNIEEKVVMWLSTFEFMTYRKARDIIEKIDNLGDLFDNLDSYRSTLLKIVTSNELAQMKAENNFVYINSCIENYDKLGILVVTCKSDVYPDLLKETGAYPIMLYCKGDVSLLKTECLGVVGSRRATKYGQTIGGKIVKDVASNKITIVSGLAEGADTIAHKSCLEAGGKTIAVLGGGLLNIFPNSNIPLAEDIVEKGGLLITEYKPNEPSLTYHFPVRNRIIAGLSKAVFIIEATEHSGSMHTKNFALDYNREVFALPARVNDIYSMGCNKVIQNGQARMVLSSSDIIDFFGKNFNDNKDEKVLELSMDEQLIYDTLRGQELSFDDLLKSTKMETKILSTMLMRMEIKGIIEKHPGNYYIIKE